jgi:hypothetical protein
MYLPKGAAIVNEDASFSRRRVNVLTVTVMAIAFKS